MLTKTQLRDYYVPFQPTVRANDPYVRYREVFPDALVADLIYCYWELKTDQPLLQPFTYRVIADGCIDLFFRVDPFDEVFVMGFYDTSTTFDLGTEFHYIGVRFFPSAFPAWFGVDAQLLSNRFQSISSVDSVLGWSKDSPLGHMDFGGWQRYLNSYFTHRRSTQAVRFDPRMLEALYLIFQHQGHLQLSATLRTGLSPRQLRRHFSYYLGTSPKLFSQVVRFQHVLRAATDRSLREDKVYFDLGYYDQAHFIRAFKSFYGITPKQAFGK